MKSNEELMKLYASGENEAFRELYRRYSPRIYGYFNSRLKNHNHADDLFQEFFNKLHANRDKYNSEFKLDPWIFTIAHNLLISFYRENNLDVNQEDNCEHLENLESSSSLETSSQVLGEFDLNVLKEKISNLPETEKKAITLRYFEEEEIDDISKILDKTNVNVRKILSRALAKLRKEFNNV